MNVIQFPRRPESEPDPIAFTLGARVDLRTGAPAAAVIRPRGAGPENFSFSNLARLIRAARLAWRERGQHSALVLAIPLELHAELEADMLSAAANEAGCTRQKFSFELNERHVIAQGPALAEDLRAHGWGLTLRGDPDCPLPFGSRARALYSELVIEPPQTPDPFLAANDAGPFAALPPPARGPGRGIGNHGRNSAQRQPGAPARDGRI